MSRTFLYGVFFPHPVPHKKKTCYSCDRHGGPAAATALRASSVAAAAAASPNGIFTVVGHIVRNENILGLWKGMTPVSFQNKMYPTILRFQKLFIGILLLMF